MLTIVLLSPRRLNTSSSTTRPHLADPARGLSPAHGQIRIGSSSYTLILSDFPARSSGVSCSASSACQHEHLLAGRRSFLQTKQLSTKATMNINDLRTEKSGTSALHCLLSSSDIHKHSSMGIHLRLPLNLSAHVRVITQLPKTICYFQMASTTTW
jgi:hypothetical protein